MWTVSVLSQSSSTSLDQVWRISLSIWCLATISTVIYLTTNLSMTPTSFITPGSSSYGASSLWSWYSSLASSVSARFWTISPTFSDPGLNSQANQISVYSFKSEKCSLWRLGIRRRPRLFHLSELLPSSGVDSAASMPWDPYLPLGLFKAMDSCRKSAVPDMPQSHWYMSTLIFNLLTILIINGTSFKDHHPLPYCIPAIWCLGRGLESQKAAL